MINLKRLFLVAAVIVIIIQGVCTQETSHTWEDQTDFPIYYTIVGDSNLFTSAHIVILTINTNGDIPTSFDISGPGSYSATNIFAINLPYSDETTDYLIDVTGSGTVYTLALEKKPDDPFGGIFELDEDCVFEISGLSGTNSIGVSIQSQNGNEDPPTTNNVYLNIPPTAAISSPASDQTINEGDSVTFAGTATDDDTASLGHAWDFDGGATNSSVEDPGAVTFSTAGTYTVTYTVTDDVGQTDSDEVTVTVEEGGTTPHPPTGIHIIGSSRDTSPLPLTFEYDGDGAAAGITNYAWDFGDGGSVAGSGEESVEHTFLTGEYEVGLTVTFADNETDTAEVTVAALPDQELSFPPHRGVPYAPQPPAIDGDIQPEEWRGCHRITYNLGAAPADVAIQALKDRNAEYLYLSFEVKKDQGFDPDDLIVLAFRPNESAQVPADDRKIFIFPFGAGHTAGDNQELEQIRIWKDSAGWPEELSALEVSAVGIEGRMKSYTYASHEAWDIELKIPTSAVTADWVDFSDYFKIYFNICKVNSMPPPPPAPQEPTDLQFAWPMGVPDFSDDVFTHDFNPEWWGRGNASGSAVLKGVYIERSDFGTYNDPVSRILLPDTEPASVTNVFFATVKNDSERETALDPDYSETIPAEDVRVRFRIAKWGIPGPSDWRDLPATAGLDPAAPAGQAITPVQDVPAAAGGTPGEATYEVEWTIDRPSQDYTDYSGNTHQCILLEIDSTGNANIVTRSTYRNMNFGYASEFSQAAVVSARGFGPPPPGDDGHTYLILVTPRQIEPEKQSPHVNPSDKDPIGTVSGTVNRQQGTIEWSAHGLRYTEDTVIINGNEYRTLASAGSFGHIVTHIGEVVDWEYELDGAVEVGENLYILGVPEDGAALITPRIRPIPFWPNGFSLHAGTATPLGNLANSYGTGFTVFGDYERYITSKIALALFCGINWFPESSGGQAYWNISTNLDIRYLLPLRGKVIPYVQTGPGMYYEDSGDLAWGANVGSGVLYRIGSHIQLEAGADLHSIFDKELQFVTAHAGVEFKF